MKVFLVASVLALGIVAMAAPFAEAKGTVTATAKESGCPKTFCFDVSPATLTGGDDVTVNFNNPSGNTQHSFCVLIGANWKCAPEAPAYANPGTSATVTFTAPASGKVEYKCSVPGHDVLGMMGNFTVQGASANTGGTNNTDGNTGETNPPPKASPSVGVIAMVVGVGLLAVALRRR
ncbi:MAG: cupredoxin domain-containing protein [Halobacteriales archaeon]|nr:cupredoxin domain-containing protein [Halobacteriales archaeon]